MPIVAPATNPPATSLSQSSFSLKLAVAVELKPYVAPDKAVFKVNYRVSEETSALPNITIVLPDRMKIPMGPTFSLAREF